MSLESLISAFGAPVIFAGCALEGETVAFLGGVMAHRGLVPVGLAGLAAALGAFASDQTVFFAGRHARHTDKVQALLARPTGVKVLALMQRHPRLFILGFRFIPGMKIAGALTIGASHIPAWHFVGLNALAVALWAVVYVGLGYHFGLALEVLAGRLPLHWLLGLAVAAVIATVLFHRWRKRASAFGQPRDKR